MEKTTKVKKLCLDRRDTKFSESGFDGFLSIATKYGAYIFFPWQTHALPEAEARELVRVRKSQRTACGRDRNDLVVVKE